MDNKKLSDDERLANALKIVSEAGKSRIANLFSKMKFQKRATLVSQARNRVKRIEDASKH
jgi:hypothetical protein